MQDERKIGDGIQQNNGSGGYGECVPVSCIEELELRNNQCVPKNNLPKISGGNIEGGQIFAGIRAKIHLNIVDDDGDEVTILPVDSENISIEWHSVVVTFLSPGVHKVSLRLDDSKGVVVRDVDFHTNIFPISNVCYSYTAMWNSRNPENAWILLDNQGVPNINGNLGVLIHNFRNYSWPEMIQIINFKFSSGRYQQMAFWTSNGQVTCFFDNNDLWN